MIWLPPQVRDYALCGVILHHGSVGGGHYTSMALNPKDETWYRFDDEFVFPVDEESVANSQAYVLFYKKRNPQADNIRSHIQNIDHVSMLQTPLIR